MAKQPRILAGQTAAITGAARGIGKATAQALLRQGMKVAIGDVDLDAARKTAAELGASTVALPLDVTDRASFTAFLDSTEEQFGPVDVLVNNAGIMQIGRFVDEDDLTAQRMIDINLHGVILGMKLALERMVPGIAATSSTSPPRPASSALPEAPPTRPPSTPSSVSARPCAASCV